MKRLAIHVSGKVQGVFFRATTKTQADQLAIKGFVQNLSDGRVYVEAEGPEDTLQKFVTWCQTGPLGARVDRVEVKEEELKNFSAFEIKR